MSSCLHLVQNVTIRMLIGPKKHEHISPVLDYIHLRIQFTLIPFMVRPQPTSHSFTGTQLPSPMGRPYIPLVSVQPFLPVIGFRVKLAIINTYYDSWIVINIVNWFGEVEVQRKISNFSWLITELERNTDKVYIHYELLNNYKGGEKYHFLKSQTF